MKRKTLVCLCLHSSKKPGTNLCLLIFGSFASTGGSVRCPLSSIPSRINLTYWLHENIETIKFEVLWNGQKNTKYLVADIALPYISLNNSPPKRAHIKYLRGTHTIYKNRWLPITTLKYLEKKFWAIIGYRQGCPYYCLY